MTCVLQLMSLDRTESFVLVKEHVYILMKNFAIGYPLCALCFRLITSRLSSSFTLSSTSIKVYVGSLPLPLVYGLYACESDRNCEWHFVSVLS